MFEIDSYHTNSEFLVLRKGEQHVILNIAQIMSIVEQPPALGFNCMTHVNCGVGSVFTTYEIEGYRALFIKNLISRGTNDFCSIVDVELVKSTSKEWPDDILLKTKTMVERMSHKFSTHETFGGSGNMSEEALNARAFMKEKYEHYVALLDILDREIEFRDLEA